MCEGAVPQLWLPTETHRDHHMCVKDMVAVSVGNSELPFAV